MRRRTLRYTRSLLRRARTMMRFEQEEAWLRAWRTAHEMTQVEAAKALGVSPRMWRYYEAGSHLLPETARLAALGFDAQARAA